MSNCVLQQLNVKQPHRQQLYKNLVENNSACGRKQVVFHSPSVIFFRFENGLVSPQEPQKYIHILESHEQITTPFFIVIQYIRLTLGMRSHQTKIFPFSRIYFLGASESRVCPEKKQFQNKRSFSSGLGPTGLLHNSKNSFSSNCTFLQISLVESDFHEFIAIVLHFLPNRPQI